MVLSILRSFFSLFFLMNVSPNIVMVTLSTMYVFYDLILILILIWVVVLLILVSYVCRGNTTRRED